MVGARPLIRCDATGASYERDKTTFRAPVSPALENVSYASRKSSKAKRCVTNRPDVELPRTDQAEQGGRGVCVDEARRDRYVFDPQILEVQRGRPAMNTGVRDSPARTNKASAQLEGFRDTDRLDRHVRA